MRKTWMLGVVALSAILSTAAAGLAAPPSRYHATFYLHETPDDPNSALRYVITFTLQPVEVDGDAVGWGLVKTTLVRPGGGGDDDVFVDAAPTVDTPDELWWVAHADADAPAIKEFSDTPPLTGVALAGELAAPDMEYSFDGHGEYVPPGGGSSPYLAFASATYVIIESGDPEPDKDGDPEPMPIGDAPPPSL
jgi:hypothetical protein